MRRVMLLVPFAIAVGALLSAQPVFRGSEILPAEEFAARRAKVFDAIGDGVAILQGTTERGGEEPFRQNNQFFYLTGVVEPRALVLLDGRTRKTTLFLQPADARRDDRVYGTALAPGDEAVRATGVDAVLPRDEFARAAGTLAGRIVYTPFRAEVLGSQSSGDPSALARNTAQDPWDGRPSREEVFRDKLKAAAAGADLKDLDPVLDAMRAVKSPREIALIREATRLTGLGIMEAMRDARPGMAEYELQAVAEFVFTKGGAFGPAYFALVATGTNTYYSHYHRNTAILRDGDLVQFDYAPDYKYYQSDVTRVFPANGRFTPRQREFYTIYLQLYRALMTSIAVHATPADVVRKAVVKMDGIMASFPFSDAAIKEAAANFVESYRTRTNVRGLGHNVGMEVHDVGGLQAGTFEPGRIFTIEPAMRIDPERLSIRLEDMILITATGYENMSAFVPTDIEEIERLMTQPGLSDAALKLEKQ
jgi:Xaa-Pro aminopeptidase